MNQSLLCTAKKWEIQDQVHRIESVHREGRTRQYGYRLIQLRALYRLLLENETQLLEAIITGTTNYPFHPIYADKPDTKNYTDAVPWMFKVLLNSVASEGARLHQKYKKLEKQTISTISSSSVLIIGSSRGMHCITTNANIFFFVRLSLLLTRKQILWARSYALSFSRSRQDLARCSRWAHMHPLPKHCCINSFINIWTGKHSVLQNLHYPECSSLISRQ